MDTREDAKLCKRDSGQVSPEVLSSCATEVAVTFGNIVPVIECVQWSDRIYDIKKFKPRREKSGIRSISFVH